MNPITLPTSPETRAALEAKGWTRNYTLNHIEGWKHCTGAMLRLCSGAAPIVDTPAPDSGLPLSVFAEVGAILHMTPVEQRKAEAYGELRDRITDAAADLDAAFLLLENGNAADIKEHLSAAIGRLMLGGKREHVSVPMDLARRYREAWYNPQQKRVRGEREEIERALAIAFRDALVVSEQTTPQPHPSEDGGPSPSPLEALSDDELQMMSDIIRREPGLHRVNPINQRKAPAISTDPLVLLEVLYNSAVNGSRLNPDVERQIRHAIGEEAASGPALHPDGQALLNIVQTGLDSYDTPRITAELKTFFAEDDEATEPREEDGEPNG